MQLDLEVHQEGPLRIVTARGEIDLATVSTFRDTLNDLILDGSVDLVVDLDGVTFLDSSGLGVLIGARRRIHAFKGSFAIVCTDGAPMQVFRITGLDKVFTFYSTQAEALQLAAPN